MSGDRHESLQAEEARNFWNQIINKGSDMKDQRLQQPSVAQ